MINARSFKHHWLVLLLALLALPVLQTAQGAEDVVCALSEAPSVQAMNADLGDTGLQHNRPPSFRPRPRRRLQRRAPLRRPLTITPPTPPPRTV
ncbi:MAG: hypothetical protein AB1766_10945 [Pseudomonadota bacterium]